MSGRDGNNVVQGHRGSDHAEQQSTAPYRSRPHVWTHGLSPVRLCCIVRASYYCTLLSRLLAARDGVESRDIVISYHTIIQQTLYYCFWQVLMICMQSRKMAKQLSLAFLNDRAMFRMSLLLSAASALLMTVLSVLGLLFPDTVYPDNILKEQYLANDVVNLLVGLPLFFAAWLWKEQLLGALLLPGYLIYTLYNYIAYFVGRPWDWIAMIGLVVATLCSAALVSFCKAMNHTTVKKALQGRVLEAISGWILFTFGLLSMSLAMTTIISSIQNEYARGKIAVAVSDLVVSVGAMVGGTMLVRSKALGYSMGLGLLVATSFLFIGLVVFFFVAPLVSDRSFDWTEVVIVLGIGLFCFIPAGIFCRGVIDSTLVTEQKTLQ